MPSVRQVIDRFFPRGTNDTPAPSWGTFPGWPPDVFAITAHLVDTSGCYSLPMFNFGGEPISFYQSTGRLAAWGRIASEWGRFDGKTLSARSEMVLQKAWSTLLDPRCGEVRDTNDPFAEEWRKAALLLLAISDQASASMGFVVAPVGRRPLANLVVESHLQRIQQAPQDLKYVPWSLCRMVPPEEVCVQPKTRTAQVGFTLRSFSHHLALLPPVGHVATSWLLGDCTTGSGIPSEPATLNLLFVPFPFTIPGDCFAPAGRGLPGDQDDPFWIERNRRRFFHLEQGWLYADGMKLSPQDLCNFLCDLIDADTEVEKVHGIIMPELALDESLARAVAQLLAARGVIDIFISGVARNPSGKSTGVRNSVYSAIISGKSILTDWTQDKHHRWKLEKHQIERYHLSDRLHPQHDWWENIDISDRTCAFYVFKGGMSLCCLICEDLARIDPVQTVIRSVGPNLVIALLMDGPQLEKRWGGRYATVLADDPGSAVLVGTSMGFLRRQARSGEKVPREVLLWKGAEGFTRSVCLPERDQALLLTLTSSQEVDFTLDGRADGGSTFGLNLSEVRPIGLKSPPPWAENL